MLAQKPISKVLPIPIPRPCPGCTERQRTIRSLADIIAGTGGAVAGMALGGPVGAEIGQEVAPYLVERLATEAPKELRRVKRKASAYSKLFSKAFKKVQKKHKMKKGCWKKGGYKRCVREAHKIAKKKYKR